MTASAILTMIVGLLLPGLVVIITKEKLVAWAKELILLFLSTVSGVLSALVSAPPSNLSAWEHVAVNIILTWVCAAVSYLASLHTSAGVAVTRTLSRATAGFGLGPSERTAP